MAIMLDTNVVLDLTNDDPKWMEWSKARLETHSAEGFIVSPMVYAEICCNFENTDEVDSLLVEMNATLAETPREALYLAAKSHLLYRQRGGTRTSGLPDFFIGAHASVIGVPILTRDTARYKTYFPEVTLICPENS